MYANLFFMGVIFSGKARDRGTVSATPDNNLQSTVCKNPSLRQEWRTLSIPQRQDYISAVQCLQSRPSILGLNHTLHDEFTNSAKKEPHCLSRGFLYGDVLKKRFGARVHPDALEAILQEADYEAFNLKLEAWPRDAVPHGVNGDFSRETTPNGKILVLKMILFVVHPNVAPRSLIFPTPCITRSSLMARTAKRPRAQVMAVR
ncbi:hypothetical protein ACHAPF_003343 [Botrytis cinerea]